MKGITDAQQKLFGWRKEFFHAKFKSVVDIATNWITTGGDDSHAFDTIPYQIACNFDNVLKLASTKRVLRRRPKESFFFEHDETMSNKATKSFDEGFRKMFEEDCELGSFEEEESPK